MRTALVVPVRTRLRQLGDDDRGYAPAPSRVHVAAVTTRRAVGEGAVAVARLR